MHVVGTAGHVDHGKSTLIAALTGIHPDRLKEERTREMTIDLGFAWMELPGGEMVGIVDVPGHRDFIENMLAGVGGIDAALFVIAADEGVMPQTREHLAILDILQVPGGVIVLTKTDLVDDPEWLDLVESEARQAVQGTILSDAPLVRVSAKTGAGLDRLVSIMGETLARHPQRPDLGRARLPVDRVFSMPGFGTVVTGTLTDGKFHLGDELEILPAGVRGRVRGLQTHNRKEDTALPGSRTAINLGGVDLDQVQRGNVVAQPGKYRTSQRLDVYFRLLPDAASPLKHNQEIKMFLWTAETVGRVRLLGAEELLPGQAGWLQIELRDPVVALRGDRYILRRPSPGETLGGGEVVNPNPAVRHKRFSAEVLQQLEAFRRGSPDEVLLQALFVSGPLPIREAVSRARLEADQARLALAELVETGQILMLEKGDPSTGSDVLVITKEQWNILSESTLSLLAGYHKSYPLRRGIPREELKSRLKLGPRLFNALLKHGVEAGLFVERGTSVALPGYEIRLNPQQEAQRRALLARFQQAPYSPPSLKECETEVGEELTNALIDTGQLVQVSLEVVFRKEDYDRLAADVRAHFSQEPALTVAQFRDRYQTSRRYALAFLEHLDAIGITQRDGDLRRLRK